MRAGRGGDGISAFRREKYVPAGGPSGGDGGRGGDVVLEADGNLQTLLDFKYKRLFQADDGRRGGPNKATGASANDLLIKVPCGTEVRDLGSGLLLGDLIDNGEQLVIAKGGKGGTLCACGPVRALRAVRPLLGSCVGRGCVPAWARCRTRRRRRAASRRPRSSCC